MYGSYGVSDLSLEHDEFSLRVELKDGFFTYVRLCNGEKVEKAILSDEAQIIVNPVEPVNLPAEITSFLQIKFLKPIVVEPESTKSIFCTFPVEIGVFVAGKRDVDVLDIFTLVRPKYTLYGTPRNGVICRYWESRVYSDLPKTDAFREGVMALDVVNESGEWVEVTKAVFSAAGMKIYYDDIVSMKAVMRVMGSSVAETSFEAKPLRRGMKKSLELYRARRIVASGKFVMELGL